MTKYYLYILILLLAGCSKSASISNSPLPETDSKIASQVDISSESVAPLVFPVEDLSLYSLVGKWILLDSEGEIDKLEDYLLVKKSGSEYLAKFKYQGETTDCVLITEGKEYFILSDSGTRYKLGRSESIRNKEHNGIWMVLGDIHLGNFQREDILKSFE